MIRSRKRNVGCEYVMKRERLFGVKELEEWL